ncbi:putative protein S-acyltransferase 19 [Dorcoceras hygrometricum]|uniref:Uncharacterized protein n=1 Tax=Dorcoceras hygrometricum TaxID=472368 RepID=A0A2Z7BNV7_9LAMI|nr:putative protein S-acyltransferase 19 [Dorcoceras hygrometricum]
MSRPCAQRASPRPASHFMRNRLRTPAAIVRQATRCSCALQRPAMRQRPANKRAILRGRFRNRSASMMRRSCGTAALMERRLGATMRPRARFIEQPSTASIAWPCAPSHCGRNRQSGPRPETRLLRQPPLEGLTRSARTDSPRRIGRNEFRRIEAAAAAAAVQCGGGGGY